MTEEEWNAGSETYFPRKMLWALEEQFAPKRLKAARAARGRKLRLFASAAIRRIWHLLAFDELKMLVDVSDRFADQTATRVHLRAAMKKACANRTEALGGLSGARYYAERAVWLLGEEKISEHIVGLVEDIFGATVNDPDNPEEEGKHQQHFLRDIFGNPFRPVAFDPAWRAEHAVGIAAKMYDERHFAAMPILADALEEAGCDSADILAHCREPGVHVRGCWVVDLVLGK